jgi:hypothetical protein
MVDQNAVIRNIEIIRQRTLVSGIKSVLPKSATMDARIAKLLKEANIRAKKDKKPAWSKASVADYVYRDEIGKVLRKDIIWLSKWCFDIEGEKSWMEECHKTAWKFLSEGMKALPKKYLDAQGQGAFFCYDENASVEGIEMPRGVGKTFTFSALRAVQEFINNPSGKWLVAHSDKFKAQKNLTSIKTLLLNPYLAVIFPEFFHMDIQSYKRAGGQVTAEKINITFNEIDEKGAYTNFRPEATFTVASPQIDRTGYHVDGIFADDLVTDETSRTPEATEKLYAYYRGLWGLRQLGQPFKIFITGTEWWEGSLYNILKKLGSKVTWFQMPAKWEDRDGKDRRLSRHHKDTYLDEQKVQMKQDYDPQMNMKAKRFDENLKLVENENDMLFSWYGEPDVPNGIPTAMFDKRNLKESGCIVSSLDPSYSNKNKSEGSDCSTATLITGVIAGSYNSDKVLYVYDVWQKLGWDLDSMEESQQALRQMYNVYSDNIAQEEVDWTVCDSQGTQKATIQDYFSRLTKHIKPNLRCSYHEKGSLMSNKGKAEKATFVLQEKFANGQIKIHWSLKPAIDQIMRRNSGFDVLDVLIQLCLPANIDWNVAHAIFCHKNRNNMYALRKKRKRKPTSGVANY